MRLSSFGYLVKQGAKNVFINRMMSLACIGVMTACLLLIGFSILAVENISNMLSFVEGQNEVIAFVKDDVSEERCLELAETIGQLRNVSSVKYVSKEEGLAQQREQFGDLAILLDGLEEDNPIPVSYRISLRDLSKLQDTLDILNSYTELDQINAPMEISVTITTLQNVLLYAGSAIIIVLILVSLIIISNTVKLTVFSHRREINIMKYCGATNSYIRLPFLIEGTIVGLVASLLSYGVVYILYQRLVNWLLTQQSGTGFLQSITQQLLPFSSFAIQLAAVFLGFGALLGLLGSVLFVRKYLKV